MATTAPVKKIKLIEAPLSVIHQDSLAWLEDIYFLKDECAFLVTLIRNTRNAPLLKTKPAKAIEKQLVGYAVRRFDDLIAEVQEHEKFLDDILEGKNNDEQLLRRRHKVIAGKVAKLETEFRKLKRQIFGLVKIKQDKWVMG